ncbi:hypothetical protein AK812_SmicGene17241 [Symbiodinium microadriaticum]|uniref:Uncharacterized protein n=1 Tax=Symbiodinium microadriaticum TaxID=2951 RepID=A0A1Q9DY75_SYMMI|nr:hypothetical protein AK812_SmicGene17241 [Symbiodinium microadriaticum]
MRTLLLAAAAAAGFSAEVGDFPKGLFTVEPLPDSEDDPIRPFVDRHMEPRHAVAVGTVPQGSKRHVLLAELADDEDLRHFLALGVLFKKGRTSLSVGHRVI